MLRLCLGTPDKPPAQKQPLNFETFVRAAMQTGKPPKPAKTAKKRKVKK